MRRTPSLFLAVLLASAAAQAQQPTPGPITITSPGQAGVSVGLGTVEALVKSAAAGLAPTPNPAHTQKVTPTPEVRPDASSPKSIVTALYASVSHGPEYEPNWARMRALFLPKAIFVPPAHPDAAAIPVLDLDAFEQRIRRYIAGRRERGEQLGFTEREIGHREHCFGTVCQVLSTYEAVRSPADLAPFARGVHSIQLVSDGRRWWIAALIWDDERPDNPIPEDLLGSAIR